MKMKSLLSKAILGSFLIFYNYTIYPISKNELIKMWSHKENYIVLSAPIKTYKLDPIKAINAHTKFMLPLVFEPLISINAQQELQPVLAKSWLISSDHKSIVITINKNHRFSDNSEVTAQDVVDSVFRLCSIGSRGHGELKGLANCEAYSKGKNFIPKVYAVGKYEIKFNITGNPTIFLYQLSSPNTVVTKLSKTGLIGSGPYVIAEQNKNNIILEKNLFYMGNFTVKNSGIIIFYTNGYDVLSMLTKDGPDGAIMYRMNDIWGFNNKKYKLIKSNPNITEILVFNNQKFPFNKEIVRKALSSAIYNNFNYACIPSSRKAFGVIPVGIGGSIANMPPYALPEITPDELFKEVPELKIKKISVFIHQGYNLKNNCESEQIIKFAKKYNIDIKFKYHKEYMDLLALEFNHNLDGFIDLYLLKNREAYSLLHYFAKKRENYANVVSADIDNMLEEAISSSSSHGRFQVYNKIAAYIQDKNIVLPIFYMDYGNLMHKCLSGINEDFFFNPYMYLPQISKIKNCKN